MSKPATSRRAGPPKASDEATPRRRLLEAAGRAFAERGFDHATGREICRAAGLNAAAVNYYYGGMDGLYAAALREAGDRLVSLEQFRSAISRAADPSAQLRALLEMLVSAAVAPQPNSWALGVIIRQIASPSPAVAELHAFPKAEILRQLVGRILRLPPDHPAVAAGCLTVVAPCFLLLIYDRTLLRRAFPSLALDRAAIEPLVDQLHRYAVGGLKAVARQATRPPKKV